jgi:hypothetical protein
MTEISSSARLYLVCLVLRENGERDWQSDERIIDAPDKAMFVAAFASLPRVVYLILLAKY